VVTLKLDGDTVGDISFEGESCAICKASASMMTTAVKGRKQSDARMLAREFVDMATGRLGAMPGVRLIGTAQAKAAVLSFELEGIHPHDVGTLLNDEGVAVRTGHHCAQPVMQRFAVPATVRASFAFYNTLAEVDALAAAIEKVQKVFA
jgi:selenocysteine lyase/cysteine desulfurase